MAFQTNNHAVLAEIRIARPGQCVGAVAIRAGRRIHGRFRLQVGAVNARHKGRVGGRVAFLAGLRRVRF